MKLKGINVTDVLIVILMSLVIAFDMDFDNLSTLDYVCIGAFSFWILAFIVRLYIENRSK